MSSLSDTSVRPSHYFIAQWQLVYIMLVAFAVKLSVLYDIIIDSIRYIMLSPRPSSLVPRPSSLVFPLLVTLSIRY